MTVIRSIPEASDVLAYQRVGVGPVEAGIASTGMLRIVVIRPSAGGSDAARVAMAA